MKKFTDAGVDRPCLARSPHSASLAMLPWLDCRPAQSGGINEPRQITRTRPVERALPGSMDLSDRPPARRRPRSRSRLYRAEARRWTRWHPRRPRQLYAGTEVHAICIINGVEWLTHAGSVGRVLLGEMQVGDDAGVALPSGESGRIWMRRGEGAPAPYMYMGAEAISSDDGWETLGDLGWFDEEGYLHLNDRETDMILVGGSNCYPATVEAALLEHPEVTDACVIGLPDEDFGSLPHALVLTCGAVTEDELRAFVSPRLLPYNQPRSYEFVEEPLRDDAGKVRRSALRAARLQVTRGFPASTSSPAMSSTRHRSALTE